MILDWLFKKEEPKPPRERRTYLIINNYPYPVRKEMVEELMSIGAPLVWFNEKGEMELERPDLYG